MPDRPRRQDLFVEGRILLVIRYTYGDLLDVPVHRIFLFVVFDDVICWNCVRPVLITIFEFVVVLGECYVEFFLGRGFASFSTAELSKRGLKQRKKFLINIFL